MCIMDYDTLQYCDFLGSVVSIWVTILCMSRVKKILKYVSVRPLLLLHCRARREPAESQVAVLHPLVAAL